jgi:hypothetical protein
MALTNAEKQRRHRARIKARLEAADRPSLVGALQAENTALHAEVAQLRAEADEVDGLLSEVETNARRAEAARLQLEGMKARLPAGSRRETASKSALPSLPTIVKISHKLRG